MSSTWGRITKETLTAIANAIRAKTGKSALIEPVDMAAEIDGIEIGGDVDGVIDGSVSGTLTTGALSVKSQKFNSCTSLTSFIGNSAQSIGSYAFTGCTGLINFVGNLVQSIGSYAFNGCTNLQSVSAEACTYIDSHAFEGCTKLESVDIRPVTVSYGAFKTCEKLSEIDLSRCTTIYDSAFQRTALTEVNAPLLTSTPNTAKNAGAFQYCYGIESINLPSISSIGSYTFSDCNMETAILKATTLGANCFQFCSKLHTVDLTSATHGSIGNAAFWSDGKLTALIIRATDAITTLSTTNSLGSTAIASGTGYIYVPAALVDTYKAATNWATYAAQIRALEDYTQDGTTTGEFVPPAA